MNKSAEWYQRAQHSLPGGVNSPVRAFKAVEGFPPFIHHAEGAYVYDIDNKSYIDYVGSWGPMILGHNAAVIREAVIKQSHQGLSFGAPTTLEVEMAEKIIAYVPSIEMVRMVNSGTEATMSAIRLARAYTGRDKIIKFAGGYHGHADCLLSEAGSGLLTLGIPSSPGVPSATAQDTLTATFNDIASVEALFAQYADSIAAIIVEPVAGNMNCIPPQSGFLSGLRSCCDKFGALLIFDEVMTGFRVALGGAQARYQISPDLTCLGKIVGGGMPAGAFGGKKEIMMQLAPNGPVYQAGTLSGNPIVMAAGLAALNAISRPGLYEYLEALTAQLTQKLYAAAAAYQIPLQVQQVGSMFGFVFADEAVTSYAQVKRYHHHYFKRFFHFMLAEGIYLAPSAFEAHFLSAAHTEAEIIQTVETAERCFKQMQAERVQNSR